MRVYQVQTDHGCRGKVPTRPEVSLIAEARLHGVAREVKKPCNPQGPQRKHLVANGTRHPSAGQNGTHDFKFSVFICFMYSQVHRY